MTLLFISPDFGQLENSEEDGKSSLNIQNITDLLNLVLIMLFQVVGSQAIPLGLRLEVRGPPIP